MTHITIEIFFPDNNKKKFNEYFKGNGLRNIFFKNFYEKIRKEQNN